MTEYRARTTVKAMQYDGTDQSAELLIHWAIEPPRSTLVERHDHLDFDPATGGDERYTTWLKVLYWGCYIEPGNWLVFDEAEDGDVLTTEQFEARYEPIGTGA